MGFSNICYSRETLFQVGGGQNEHARTEMEDMVNIGLVESTAQPQYHSGGCGGVRRGRGELRLKSGFDRPLSSVDLRVFRAILQGG